MATETILTPTCTNCGELCTDGYTVKMLGERDRETGYQDEEIICGDCFQVDLEDRSAPEEALDDDGRYEEGDRKFEGWNDARGFGDAAA